MAINFNQIPDEKPDNGFTKVPKGTYIANIVKAEMKASKADPPKPDYLSLSLECLNEKGETIGTVFDNLTQSQSPLPLYKIKRLIQALEIPINDTFNLKDLTKIIVGKQLKVDIDVTTFNGKERSQVDISNEIYYPVNNPIEATPTAPTGEMAPTGETALYKDMEETF